MKDDLNQIDELMRTLPGDLPPDALLSSIGQLIDLSTDARSADGLERSLELIGSFDWTQAEPRLEATGHYFAGNAWSMLGKIHRASHANQWSWDDKETEQEVIAFRRAIAHLAFGDLHPVRRAQILTNIGNAFSRIGRFVEAIEYWDRAILLVPNFGMAIGNKGRGLRFYAGSHYDNHEAHILLKGAWQLLNQALEAGDMQSDVGTLIEGESKWIEGVLDRDYLSSPLDLETIGDPPIHKVGLGRLVMDNVLSKLKLEKVSKPRQPIFSTDEAAYRNWCLEERLFLSPLNDLGIYREAARDPIATPSIVTNIGEGPHFQGFFNQLKQEYVSARFMLYIGRSQVGPHFSDRDVLLLNTLDYPDYSIFVELEKAAYRTLYSLFDKIALFLNWYLDLAIKDGEVNFRRVWTASKGRQVRDDLTSRPNWPLRGLFWLHKDLYSEYEELGESLEPGAQRIWTIRRHLEHRYLKLHNSVWSGLPLDGSHLEYALADKKAFSLYRTEFREKLLRLAKLARAALIYLSLSIYAEERRKASERGNSSPLGFATLEPWHDEWKL